MVVISSPRLAAWTISADADGGQVAVALVGEDHLVRADPLDAGGHRRGAPVGRLRHVQVEVVVGQHRAAHRGDADGPLPHAQLVEHLGDQAVDDAVGAAGAVVGVGLGQALRLARRPVSMSCGDSRSCRLLSSVVASSCPARDLGGQFLQFGQNLVGQRDDAAHAPVERAPGSAPRRPAARPRPSARRSSRRPACPAPARPARQCVRWERARG